ncbi:MAG: c-type cytochrome [Elusimicrobia bacterium]|nr:c-type cytochrome [Elusimicrobiota bacterium]
MPPIIKKLFIWGNLGLVLFLIASVARDESREWKKYQKKFFELEAQELQTKLASSADEEEKHSLEKQIRAKKKAGLEVRQMIVGDLNRIDRCITCHVGMDPLSNPALETPFKENPYRGHPGDFLKTHAPNKYGCTVCHQGQGLATTVKDAHGFVKHWEEPLLKPPFIQASCAKCHANFENIPYAQTAKLGKELFTKNGCYGCHAIKGWGGIISEDLGEIASKPLSRALAGLDLSKTKLSEDQMNIQTYIMLHLTKDPMELVPGDPLGHMGDPISPSGMPPFYLELKEDEAKAIATYLMSMASEKMPHDYYVYAPPKPEPSFDSPAERGKYVYQKYGCAACHGVEAKDGHRNFNAQGPGQDPNAEDQIAQMAKGKEPNLRETAGTFTREELRVKIQNGVPSTDIVKFKADGPTPPLYMPAWKDKIKGQELEDLITYLLSIAKKGEEW